MGERRGLGLQLLHSKRMAFGGHMEFTADEKKAIDLAVGGAWVVLGVPPWTDLGQGWVETLGDAHGGGRSGTWF